MSGYKDRELLNAIYKKVEDDDLLVLSFSSGRRPLVRGTDADVEKMRRVAEGIGVNLDDYADIRPYIQEEATRLDAGQTIYLDPDMMRETADEIRRGTELIDSIDVATMEREAERTVGDHSFDTDTVRMFKGIMDPVAEKFSGSFAAVSYDRLADIFLNRPVNSLENVEKIVEKNNIERPFLVNDPSKHVPVNALDEFIDGDGNKTFVANPDNMRAMAESTRRGAEGIRQIDYDSIDAEADAVVGKMLDKDPDYGRRFAEMMGSVYKEGIEELYNPESQREFEAYVASSLARFRSDNYAVEHEVTHIIPSTAKDDTTVQLHEMFHITDASSNLDAQLDGMFDDSGKDGDKSVEKHVRMK